MNILSKFYLNDQTRFALPKYKQSLRAGYAEILNEAEVIRIEDKLNYCWTEYGELDDCGGIVNRRFYSFSDGRMDTQIPARFYSVLEPLPENPITLDNYKNYLDYLER